MKLFAILLGLILTSTAIAQCATCDAAAARVRVVQQVVTRTTASVEGRRIHPVQRLRTWRQGRRGC